MNSTIILVFSVFLFAGVLVPAHAQISENVVINEIDINPPGDDSAAVSEWIELYNPTDSDVDIGGWEIASTTALKKTMTISSDTVIEPGQFLTYSYQSLWFADTNESVELRDDAGVVIDSTPSLSDTKNDFTSWQRLYDGYDSDSSDDWKFVVSTAGSSNGKLVETQSSEELSVTVLEHVSYIFGDVAVIEGSVSKEVFVLKPFFKSEQITVTITGPDFHKIITLYPDLNLNYKTTLSLHQVLGINEGTYNVSVDYAGATADTSFSVGHEIIKEEIQKEGDIGIRTDKSQYLPGETVSIAGFATDIVPFQGMKFTVTDALGIVVDNGILFPTDGEFLTSVFLTTVDPIYGVYDVSAEYSDKTISTSFEVVEDFKENTAISLWSDKVAYQTGDTVTLTGRINQVWISTLDLQIVQTKQSSINTPGSYSGFKILDSLRILGDGSFTYSFEIPENPLRQGDYKIDVSKDIGTASLLIHVVDDPENFVVSSDRLTVETDAPVYELGESMSLSGFVKNLLTSSSYTTGSVVDISVTDENGDPIEILTQSNVGQSPSLTSYDFTAIPDTSGKYSTQIDIVPNFFKVGTYVITAQYNTDVATTTFSVVDPLDLNNNRLSVSIDKDIYGLGEVVHLDGIVPPLSDPSVVISVIRPDGTRTDSGAIPENQRFSFNWTVPAYEKPPILKDDDGRNVRISNYGVYKITIATVSQSTNLFFKVSEDPANDSLSTIPLFVSTEKSLYKAGERLKVLGNVIQRSPGNEGLAVKERVQLRVIDGTFPFEKIHEANVYPTQGGEFSSLFELPPTIFSEGEYIVRANYNNAQTDTRFSVANDFVVGTNIDLSLLLNLDKPQYHPGDVVVVSGKPSKLIYLEKFQVSTIKKSDAEINCGTFICGTNTGPVTEIKPTPSGSFVHEFMIPNDVSSIGSYETTVDAGFEIRSITFDVIAKPSSTLDTVIVKENRISESVISIPTGEKADDDGVSIAPRVLTGSLITPSRGEESNVNLKVSSENGTCIVGPDADCLVQESTRKPGQIYDVVTVDGLDYNVRYSGPDVRLEKFSILPESPDEFLPDTNWSVKVVKDEQISRFYYKITYKTLE